MTNYTHNKVLVIPPNGDPAFTGSWDGPLNGNATAIDGMFGGIATIAAAGAYTLTVPAAGGPPVETAGPTDSQNALIRFSGGALSSNMTVTFKMPGFYIVENLFTFTDSFVVILTGGAGKQICAPPGQMVHVFFDGTDMKYVNLPPIGTFMDIVASTVPLWITTCTVPPYLNCDGTALSAVTYPYLYALLNARVPAWTGNLPDARGQTRFALNQTTGRTTLSGGFGLDGNTLLARGGSQTLAQQQLPNVNFTFTVTAPYTPGTVVVNPTAGGAFYGSTGTPAGGGNNGSSPLTFSTAGVTVTIPSYTPTGSAASGGLGNPLIPPGLVHGLTLIRAG